MKLSTACLIIIVIVIIIGVVSLLSGDGTLARIAADIFNVKDCGATICPN